MFPGNLCSAFGYSLARPSHPPLAVGYGTLGHSHRTHLVLGPLCSSCAIPFFGRAVSALSSEWADTLGLDTSGPGHTWPSSVGHTRSGHPWPGAHSALTASSNPPMGYVHPPFQKGLLTWAGRPSPGHLPVAPLALSPPFVAERPHRVLRFVPSPLANPRAAFAPFCRLACPLAFPDHSLLGLLPSRHLCPCWRPTAALAPFCSAVLASPRAAPAPS